MARIPLPDSFDELMLTLTNEREFHDIFERHVKRFIHREITYEQFRQKIYSFLCKHFEKYTNCATVTSVVVWRGLLHYREEFKYTSSQAYTACLRMCERWMQYTFSHCTNNNQSYEGRKLNEEVQYWIRHKDAIKQGKMKSPKSDAERLAKIESNAIYGSIKGDIGSAFIIDDFSDFSDIKPIPYQGTRTPHDDNLDAIPWSIEQAQQLLTEVEKQQLLNQATPPLVFNHLTNLTESIMPINAKAPICNVTYIYGADAANVTDAQIFEHIRTIENEIKNLEAIKSAPIALTKRIKELYKDIEALVQFSNDRQPKTENAA